MHFTNKILLCIAVLHVFCGISLYHGVCKASFPGRDDEVKCKKVKLGMSRNSLEIGKQSKLHRLNLEQFGLR